MGEKRSRSKSIGEYAGDLAIERSRQRGSAEDKGSWVCWSFR